MLSWSGGTQTATADTVYEVVPSSRTHVLTLADTDRTVIVAVGDTIEADLGTGLTWQLTVSDPAVLQPTAGPRPAGAPGPWAARGVGRAVIAGHGDPPCYPRCRAPSQRFAVTVIVTN